MPLPADDAQIHRFIEHNCNLTVNSFYRETLRVDGLLTNCKTGNRIFHVDPFSKNLPRYIKTGKYNCNLIYKGQNVINPDKPNVTCNKYLEKGHKQNQCKNDWKCRSCGKSGHKGAAHCEEPFETSEENQDKDETTKESDDEEDESESEHEEEKHEVEQEQQTQLPQPILKPQNPNVMKQKQGQQSSTQEMMTQTTLNTNETSVQ